MTTILESCEKLCGKDNISRPALKTVITTRFVTHIRNCPVVAIWYHKRCYYHGGKIVEQLNLFESSELRRLPKDKENVFEPVSEGFRLQYEQQAETSAYGKSANKSRENWVPNPKGAKPKDVIDIPTTCK